MATFTTTIHELIESDFDFGLDVEDYPIFDERHRGERVGNRWLFHKPEMTGLNAKILDHYMLDEIGQETPDLFRLMLNRKMREIMPYYNQLYMTEFGKLKFDPFETMSVTNTTGGKTSTITSAQDKATSNATADTESKGRNVSSQFPQTMLNDGGGYATAGADSYGDTKTSEGKNATSTSSGSGTVTEDRAVTMRGSQGSKATLLRSFRESLLNIDMMVVNELSTLFMGLVTIADNVMERNFTNYGSRQYGLWPYL